MMNKELNPNMFEPIIKRVENDRPYSVFEDFKEIQTGVKTRKAERTLSTKERKELKKAAREQSNSGTLNEIIPITGTPKPVMEVESSLDYGELIEGELFSFVPVKK